ncbi:MAG: recombinase family protein [Alphaproteobacteria bacterium]|nr:recombinase family protein [Alphaproteobacteria bacterium]
MDLFNKNGKKKAAVYIRMSTEHQKYSPENQMAAIRVYVESSF